MCEYCMRRVPVHEIRVIVPGADGPAFYGVSDGKAALSVLTVDAELNLQVPPPANLASLHFHCAVVSVGRRLRRVRSQRSWRRCAQQASSGSCARFTTATRFDDSQAEAAQQRTFLCFSKPTNSAASCSSRSPASAHSPPMPTTPCLSTESPVLIRPSGLFSFSICVCRRVQGRHSAGQGAERARAVLGGCGGRAFAVVCDQARQLAQHPNAKQGHT